MRLMGSTKAFLYKNSQYSYFIVINRHPFPVTALLLYHKAMMTAKNALKVMACNEFQLTSSKTLTRLKI